MALVLATVERAARGRFNGALITGEAGIGKTRLVADVVDEAATGGVRTFVGRCAELDRFRPFVPLATALGCNHRAGDARRVAIAHSLRAGDADLGPATAGYGPIETQVIQGIVELVEDIAVDGTMLIVLDDLHWADRSTLAALRAIGTDLADLPIAVVATTRPHPRNPDLDVLLEGFTERPIMEMTLDALSAETVAKLAADVLGKAPSAGLLHQLERASGNAFFVLELISALREQGMEDVELEAGSDVGVTASVRLTVLRRVGHLPASVVDLLRLAAVLGSSFSVGDLSVVTNRDVHDLAADVDVAVRSAVLVEDGRELRFRHDLVREALYSDVPTPVRIAQHHEIGQRLARSGADPARVAAHFVIGASRGDVEAAEYIQRAARTISPGAPGVAADLLAHALDLVDRSCDLGDTIEADLALLSLWRGDANQAEARARAVLSRQQRGAIAAGARRALIESLFHSFRWADGADEARRGLAADGLSQQQRGHLLCFLAHGQLYSGEVDAAGRAAEEAARIADDAGDDYMAGYAIWVRGEHAITTGDLDAAERFAGEALAASRRASSGRADLDQTGPWAAAVAGAHHDVGTALLSLATIAVASMDLGRARAHLDEAIAHLDRIGSVAYLAFAWAQLGAVHYLAAELETAQHLLVEAQRTREASELPVFSQVAALLVLLHLHRGDVGAARAELARLDASRPAVPWIRVLVDAVAGEHDGGRALQQASDVAPFRQFDVGTEPWLWEIELLHVALAAKQPGIASTIVESLDDRARRLGTEWSTGYALHGRGLRDRDVESLVEATSLLHSSDLLMAHAAEDAGTLCASTGDHERGAALLQQAAGIYERAGATHRLRSVVATMRSAGMTPTVRRTRRRATTGWDALTAAELEVVALAVEGLTNPEIGGRLFISRRTVQSHLSHVFTKLGISSRVELANAAAARGHSSG